MAEINSTERIAGIAAQLAELDKEIERLQAEQRWVPVSERLPEPNTMVLAAFDDGFVASVSHEDDWELWDDSGEITHWMPLPEAPKQP